MSCPATRIQSYCACSSPLRQRSSVDLPEPLLPSKTSTSPAAISKLTPRITGVLPYFLCKFCTLTNDMETTLKFATEKGKREADNKVNGAYHHKHPHWLHGGVVHQIGGSHQFGHADNTGQRGILHNLHKEADG